MIKRCLLAAVGALMCMNALADTALLTPHTPVVVPGGAGGFDWMAVDAPMHRLLAGHKGTGTLTVLDLRTEKIIASVPTGGAQGVAVDTADNRVFVGTDQEHTIVALDRSSLKRITVIHVSGPVDDVAYDPHNGMIYADNDDGEIVWVVDPRACKVVGTVTIPSAPEYVEFDAKSNLLYQNIKSNHTVQIIDPSTNKVVKVWQTLPAELPHGLAIDHATRHLFTAGSNGKLVMLSLGTGKQLAVADIAAGVDQIVFDAASKRIYCACRGAISVVQETASGVRALGSVPMHGGAHTITVDPVTHAVWICYPDGANSLLQKFTAH